MTRALHAPRPRRRSEAGTVLLLLVLMLFVIFGIASITIDVGLARLTQSSMQVAVDGACIEGLRWRDEPLSATPAEREFVRRELARFALLRTFDEDGLNLDELADGTQPNLLIQLGAGPDILDGASGSLAGGPMVIGSGGSVVHVPDPQLNLDNVSHGDFVAGTFLESVDPLVCAALIGTSPGYLENATYDRCDYRVPASVGDPAESVAQSAFLARLRRTGDPLGLDGVGGVSSRGLPIPLLFGRASMLDPMPDSNLHDGLTVRATAIADGRPAMLVTAPGLGGAGLAVVTVDSSGDGLPDDVATLALDIAAWEGCLADGLPHTAAYGPGGELLVPGVCDDTVPAGLLIPMGGVVPACVAVGEAVATAGEGLDAPPEGLVYVALQTDVDPSPTADDVRVVGFGAITISPASAAGDFDLQRVDGPDGAGLVAATSARAVYVPEDHPVLDATTLSAVLTAQAGLTGALLAPALVR